MIIKSDFVTNSSTTSFVLNCRAVGTFSSVKDIKQVVTELFNAPEDNYGKVKIESFIKSNDFSGGNIEHDNVDINLTQLYDSDKILVDLKTTNLEVNKITPISIGLKNIIEVARMIFGSSSSVRKFKMFFYQTGEEWGDGWNGGDPMGYYKDSTPFFKQVSKIGTIEFKENIEIEIVSIGGKKKKVKYEN